MENNDNTPILVWLPHNKAYLALNTGPLYDTATSILFDKLWKGENNIRKYVAIPKVTDNFTIRDLAYTLGQTQHGEI